MSNQLVISSGAKVRNLDGVITGSTGVLNSLPINGSNGIPQLDVNGKILVSQLPNSVMEYKGTWDASTNTPTLVNGTGNQGDVYLCSVAGTVNFGAGPIAFVVSDQVIYSGTIWQKASGTSGTVTSVSVTESGDALTITGSPVTTSGTINIGFAGTSAQYVAGNGSLVTFPDLTGYVTLTTNQTISGAKTFTTSNVFSGANLFTTFSQRFNQGLGILETANPGSSYGYTNIVGAVNGLALRLSDDGKKTFAFASGTSNNTFTFPDASGTVALTSNLTAYVPYTGATADLNLGTHNLFTNNLFEGFTSVSASSTPIVLTIASTPVYLVTGSGGQTIKLPDATTLPLGTVFVFNNNQSSGAILVNNNSNTLVVSIPSGGYCNLELTDNSIAAGSWDRHFQAPSNVSWSTNTFDYPGSITSATWNGNVVAINRGGTGASTASTALANLGGVPTTRTLTINGTTYDLSADRSWSINSMVYPSAGIAVSTGTAWGTSITDNSSNWNTAYSLRITSATSPLSITSNVLSISQATTSTNGYLSSTDWTTFNNKQNALTNPITGTGTSGQVTYFNGTSSVTGSNNFKFDGTNLTVGNPSSALAQLHVYNASAAATILLQTNSTTDYSEIAVRNNSSTATSYFRQYSTAATGSDFGISRAGLALFFSNYATNFAIGTRNGGDLILGTNDIERARVLSSNGYFGLGTSTPSYLLDVNGTGRFTGALTGTSATFTSGTTGPSTGITSIGDITAARTSTTGAIFLGTTGSKYLYYDGTKYILNASPLEVGGSITATSATFSSKLAVGGANNANTFNVKGSNTNSQVEIDNLPSGTNYILSYDRVANGYKDLLLTTTSGNNQLYLATSGNVGIGTSSPQVKLDLQNGNAGFYNNTASSGGAQLYLGDMNFAGGAYATSAPGIGAAYNSGQGVAGDLAFYIYASTASSRNEAMRIKGGTGNVGIGTSSPSALLHLSQSTINLNLYLQNTNGSGKTWAVNSDNLGSFNIHDTTANRLTITSGGNVRVNSTTDINSRGVAFQVSGTETAQFYGYGNGYGIGLFMCPNSAATGTHTAIAFRSPANGDVGSITTTSSATLYNVTSDYRLKQDLKDYSGLNLISAIKTYDYEWKLDKTRMYGVLAHELAEVIPYAVTGEKDGKEMQGVDYSKIVPILVKAIQELKAEINELKNK